MSTFVSLLVYVRWYIPHAFFKVYYTHPRAKGQ